MEATTSGNGAVGNGQVGHVTKASTVGLTYRTWSRGLNGDGVLGHL